MPVRSGRFKHPIRLHQMSSTKDNVGQQVETWTEIGSAWARVEPVRGREYFAASGEKAAVSHRITFRGQNDLTLGPRDRVIFGARTFEIQSVINVDEMDREWQLMCVEELHTTDG